MHVYIDAIMKFWSRNVECCMCLCDNTLCVLSTSIDLLQRNVVIFTRKSDNKWVNEWTTDKSMERSDEDDAKRGKYLLKDLWFIHSADSLICAPNLFHIFTFKIVWMSDGKRVKCDESRRRKQNDESDCLWCFLLSISVVFDGETKTQQMCAPRILFVCIYISYFTWWFLQCVDQFCEPHFIPIPDVHSFIHSFIWWRILVEHHYRCHRYSIESL